MKKIVVTPFLLLISALSFSQEAAISVEPNFSSAFYLQVVTGAGSRNGKPGISASAEYVFPSESRFSFGARAGYACAQVKFQPAYFGQPPNERIPYSEKANLFSFGILSRFALKKSYLFLEPFYAEHRSVRMQSELGDQSGLGLAFGYGRNFSLSEKLFLKFEPIMRIYNLVSFEEDDLPLHLISVGIKAGIGIGY